MVIDTSAILGNEPEAALFAEKIASGEALLFKGEDFSQTDLLAA